MEKSDSVQTDELLYRLVNKMYHTSYQLDYTKSGTHISFQTNNPLSREVNNYPVYTNTKDNNWQARSSYCFSVNFFRITYYRAHPIPSPQK